MKPWKGTFKDESLQGNPRLQKWLLAQR